MLPQNAAAWEGRERGIRGVLPPAPTPGSRARESGRGGAGGWGGPGGRREATWKCAFSGWRAPGSPADGHQALSAWSSVTAVPGTGCAAPGPARSAPPAAEAPSGERAAGGRGAWRGPQTPRCRPGLRPPPSAVAAEGARSTCGLVSHADVLLFQFLIFKNLAFFKAAGMTRTAVGFLVWPELAVGKNGAAEQR